MVMGETDFKDPDLTDVPEPRSMLGASTPDQPLSVFVESPESPDFAEALDAVEFLATSGESFLPPILHIISQLNIDIDGALSPIFSFVEVNAIPLLDIANSVLFPIISDTFITSEDILLLLGCANLVAACGGASKACLDRFIQCGLHDSFFACLPRLLSVDATETINAVLDALTIILKRLSWLQIRVRLSSEHLDAVFSLTHPLSEESTLPFVRFLHSLMASEFLDHGQASRVENVMSAILHRCFLLPIDQVGDELRDRLRQLAEIATVFGRPVILHKIAEQPPHRVN
jgi:hypothetical protein